MRATVAEADSVLASARFGYDARLAHFHGEQALAEALLILCAPMWRRSSRLR